MNGVPVEIHFRPSFLNAPWSNLCFQKLFKSAVFENKEIDECVDSIITRVMEMEKVYGKEYNRV